MTIHLITVSFLYWPFPVNRFSHKPTYSGGTNFHNRVKWGKIQRIMYKKLDPQIPPQHLWPSIQESSSCYLHNWFTILRNRVQNWKLSFMLLYVHTLGSLNVFWPHTYTNLNPGVAYGFQKIPLERSKSCSPWSLLCPQWSSNHPLEPLGVPLATASGCKKLKIQLIPTTLHSTSSHMCSKLTKLIIRFLCIECKADCI